MPSNAHKSKRRWCEKSPISKGRASDFDGIDTQPHLPNFASWIRSTITRTMGKYNFIASATIVRVTTWPDYTRLWAPYRWELKWLLLDIANAISKRPTPNEGNPNGYTANFAC